MRTMKATKSCGRFIPKIQRRGPSLCELLSALSVHISPIVFDDHALAPAHERMQVYALPEACRPALKRIMDALKQAHLIEEESGLYSRYVRIARISRSIAF